MYPYIFRKCRSLGNRHCLSVSIGVYFCLFIVVHCLGKVIRLLVVQVWWFSRFEYFEDIGSCHDGDLCILNIATPLVTFPAASSTAVRYSSLYRALHVLIFHDLPTGAIPHVLGTSQLAPFRGLAGFLESFPFDNRDFSDPII